MFKKLFITAAGLLLSGQAALAQYDSGNRTEPTTETRPVQAAHHWMVFVGSYEGVKITVQMFIENGMIKGNYAIEGTNGCPFVGKNTASGYVGTMKVDDGTCEFKAFVKGSAMIFTTNGHMVPLRLDEEATAALNPGAATPPANDEVVTPSRETPAKPSVVRQVQGQHSTYPLMKDWTVQEADNCVMVTSPNQLYYYAAADFTTTETSLKKVVRGYLEKLPGRNLRILTTIPSQTDTNDATLKVEVTYETEAGVQHLWIGAGLMNENGRLNATMFIACTPESAWNNQGETLKDLAMKIRVR